MHYFQFNVGDYARDTAHLTEMEDLAYRRMLDLYYKLEGPLPGSVDEIARLIRMRSHTESIAVVLQDFFVSTADGYRNNRADREMEAIYDKSDKARQAAMARWNKNKDLQKAPAMRTHSEGNADGMLHITHNPLPNNTDHLNEKSSSPVKQKGSRLSAEWQIPDDWITWATQQGIASQAARFEADKFRDFWIAKPGQGGVKSDWQATWRNWIRNVISRDPKMAQQQQQSKRPRAFGE